MTKQCSKCGEVKEVDRFYYRKDSNKYRDECKKCCNKKNKLWAKNNRDKSKTIKKKWQDSNPKYNKEYYKIHKEELTENSNKYYQNNKEKVKEYNRINGKKYRTENSEKNKARHRKYRQENKTKINEYRNRRLKTDIKYKLKRNISNLIWYRLKGRRSSKNNRTTLSILPYTLEELKKHLENQFEPWMNWDNWGIYKVNGSKCWNIHHKKADSLFNYTSVEDEEFQKCWALKNLMPLEALENIKRGNKIL